MKISILLPYKENFSPIYPGAVSLFINDTLNISKFKNNTTIYGNTSFKKTFKLNYVNVNGKNKFFISSNKSYVKEFINIEKINNSRLIEIHNRPSYLKYLIDNLNNKIYVLYFHNDPLVMNGSQTVSERLYLINNCFKIIFNSNWSKNRFLTDLENFYHKSDKLKVINQSASRVNVDLSKKKNIITFVGKLNKAKGYDLFGKAIIKILNEYKNWSSIVAGDEPREKINFHHKNLKLLGFVNHKKILNIFKESSIAVVCSRWEEPFGRTSLEASSRGCAVIISNKGGLPETITHGIIIRNLTFNNIYKSIKKLIENKSARLKHQKLAINNFYLTHQYISKKIDNYREKALNKNFKNNYIKSYKEKLKILHITNFNERHNGRLFYNTGRRINNGLIRLNHSVLEFSDRDIVSYHRSINDLNGSKKLNSKLIETISNYVPDLIIIGHADLIKLETLNYIKKNYPNIKIAQWFLDRMDDQWSMNKERFLHKIDFVDCSFCTTWPNSINLPKNKKIYYIPNPMDESFEKLNLFNKKNFYNDVFFAMSHGVHRGILKEGKHDEREKFISKLIEKTPNLKFDIYGMQNNQPIWADDFINSISNSKMGINLSQGKPLRFYSSDRITQLIGNGILTFIDKKTGYDYFFTNKEMVFYNNINDLSEKLIKYSEDDKSRIKIARNGKNKYKKYFNSKLVADYIIKKTLGVKYKKFYWEK